MNPGVVAGPLQAAPVNQRERWWRRERGYLLAITPATLLLTLFFVVPALWSIYVSFTDLAFSSFIRREPSFIGLDNYRRLWNDPDFPKYVKNTVVFVLGAAVLGQAALGIGLALLFHHATQRRHRLAGPAFAAVMTAWISPPLLTGFVWGRIVDVNNGVLNTVLDRVGLGPVDLVGNHAMRLVIAVESWRSVAFATLVILGALRTIPPQIYEAAKCDGAGALRGFADHTLPLLAPALSLVLVMATISTAGSFLMILVLTNGDPGRQTETVALFAYHRAFQSFEIAFGAAITVVLLAANAAFAVVYFLLLRERT